MSEMEEMDRPIMASARWGLRRQILISQHLIYRSPFRLLRLGYGKMETPHPRVSRPMPIAGS